MVELTEEAIEYWNDRASEPLRFEPFPEEFCAEYNRTHPLPSKEEILAEIRRSQGKE